MRKLRTVFNFEFVELIKKRALIISTLIISLVLFLITFAPRLMTLFNKFTSGSGSENEIVEVDTQYVVVATDASLFEYFDNDDYFILETDLMKVRKQIEDKDIEVAYILDSLTSYTVLKYDDDLFSNDFMFESILYQINKEKNLIEHRIDPSLVSLAEDVFIESKYEIIGKDASQGYFVGYIFLFGLYILILSYGQLVASTVAREKDSRAMELLITSTDPKILILGKVFAAGLVGVVQVMIMMGFVWIGFQINKSTYPDMFLSMIDSSIAFDTLLIYAVFSTLGYLLYLFIYAALGSMVSKIEDLGTAIGPVTILFVIAYMIASLAMNTPDTTIVKVGSYIPFVSLFTTPIRYMLTSVEISELVISLAIMLVVTYLIAQLSIYIYRLGSLNYGNRMKLLRIFKSLFSKSKG